LDDIDRYYKQSNPQSGGKIKMDIGGTGENMVKVSETNLTYEGGSILQPDTIVSSEQKKKNNELKEEIKELTGGDDDIDDAGNSGGGGKKISFNLK
jgi:hypothetical protein